MATNVPLAGNILGPSNIDPGPQPYGVWGDAGSGPNNDTGGNGVVGTSSGINGVGIRAKATGQSGVGISSTISGNAVRGMEITLDASASAAQRGVEVTVNNGDGFVIGISARNFIQTPLTANLATRLEAANFNNARTATRVRLCPDDGGSASFTGGVGVDGSLQAQSVGGNSIGVVGTAENAGMAAFNSTNGHAAYLASNCCAAWFTGDVHVAGTLSKDGGGFKIDHPEDPGGKYLAHSFVESPDMKNMYDGVVTADANGEAMVDLPTWFDAINHELRYQLTPLGGAAPDLHVARELESNCFRIAGAKPAMRICWQVTGVRRDAWANAHRIEVEEEKKNEERGYYLHPELHGAPADKSIAEVRHPLPQELQGIRRA